jgi:cellulose synthase/poly-beta-1,6-N-acetylglucosamine synthase-like glycosyltransferase
VTGGPLSATVVVPVFQGARTLARCLASIARQDAADRLAVVVVDDGSTDGSGEIARSFAGARVIEIPHAGRAAALNRGIAAAAGDVVLFTDADCEVPPDWAGTLLSLLERDPSLTGVGGNMLPRTPTAVEVAKVLPYLHEFAHDQVLEGRYRSTCLNGNSMAIRRAALVDVGGFAEGYLHGADADLTRRLLGSGHRLLRTTRAPVVHLKQERLAAYLRTRFARGSTVRFAMEERAVRPVDLLRPLARGIGDLARDHHRLRELPVLRRRIPLRARLLAPWVALLGAWVNAAGQVRYYRRFRREFRDEP